MLLTFTPLLRKNKAPYILNNYRALIFQHFLLEAINMLHRCTFSVSSLGSLSSDGDREAVLEQEPQLNK